MPNPLSIQYRSMLKIGSLYSATVPWILPVVSSLMGGGIGYFTTKTGPDEPESYGRRRRIVNSLLGLGLGAGVGLGLQRIGHELVDSRDLKAFKKDPNLKIPADKFIAHRGYRLKYPENTRIAFNKAIDAGAKNIEFDTQTTKDGKTVVAHDPSCAWKATDKDGFPVFGRICDFTLDQLRSFEWGSHKGSQFKGEPIMEYKDALALMKKHNINPTVEVKDLNPATLNATVSEIQKQNMQDKATVMSFRPSDLKKVKSIDPSISTSLFTVKTKAMPSFIYMRLLDKLTDKGSIDKVAIHRFRRMKDAYALLRSKGIQPTGWTENKQIQWLRNNSNDVYTYTDDIGGALSK